MRALMFLVNLVLIALIGFCFEGGRQGFAAVQKNSPGWLSNIKGMFAKKS